MLRASRTSHDALNKSLGSRLTGQKPCTEPKVSSVHPRSAQAFPGESTLRAAYRRAPNPIRFLSKGSPNRPIHLSFYRILTLIMWGYLCPPKLNYTHETFQHPTAALLLRHPVCPTGLYRAGFSDRERRSNHLFQRRRRHRWSGRLWVRYLHPYRGHNQRQYLSDRLETRTNHLGRRQRCLETRPGGRRRQSFHFYRYAECQRILQRGQQRDRRADRHGVSQC